MSEIPQTQKLTKATANKGSARTTPIFPNNFIKMMDNPMLSQKAIREAARKTSVAPKRPIKLKVGESRSVKQFTHIPQAHDSTPRTFSNNCDKSGLLFITFSDVMWIIDNSQGIHNLFKIDVQNAQELQM
jgi:hypothetical protein